jgi:hypothetical protein
MLSLNDGGRFWSRTRQAASVPVAQSLFTPSLCAALAWEALPEPRPQLTLEIFSPSGQVHVSYLGPHASKLTSREIDLLHGIWLELSNEVAPEELHHHDVVHLALDELRKDIHNSRRQEIIDALRNHLADIRQRRTPNA